MEYKTRELLPEEAEALSKDLQDVLKKHNCEMGVRSMIELLKYVEEPEVSPIQSDGKGGVSEVGEEAAEVHQADGGDQAQKGA